MLPLLKKHKYWNEKPDITREYTPGSCRDSRKFMRLPLQREMRHNSPALHAQQFHVPNTTRKETWFAWWNSRESPRTTSEVYNDSDVTKGMWNCSVKPKSFRDDPQLSCIGWSAIPFSPCYKTGGLSYFRQLQRLPDIHVSNPEEHQFMHRSSRKAPWRPYHLEKRAGSQDSIEDVGQRSTSTSRVAFPQQ